MKRMELLNRLAEETKDEALRREILENLACDRQELDAFRDNTEGYVYVTKWRRDHEDHYNACGYFASLDMAHAHGMTLEREFLIEKQLIIGFRGQRPKAVKDYFNPYISGESELWKCVNEFDGTGHPVADAWYNENGTLKHFYGYETDRNDEEVITTRSLVFIIIFTRNGVISTVTSTTALSGI